MKLRTMHKAIAGLALLLMGAGTAVAHTTSIGYVPGAGVGDVTFWTGSYSHGGTPVNEGILTLTGVDVAFSASVAFNIGPVGTKPTGLVDGTNNFFWGNFSGGSYPFPLNTDPNLFGGVVWWQGVTFTGLQAGTYDVTCGANCGVTAQWASLNGAGDTVRLTLTGRDIGGGDVPEPATLALMSLGLLGLGVVRRRKNKA